ncbi:hypothetical protein HpNP4_29920 [Helicobacter pylori]
MKWIGNDWGTNWNGGLKNKALRLNTSLNKIKHIIKSNTSLNQTHH